MVCKNVNTCLEPVDFRLDTNKLVMFMIISLELNKFYSNKQHSMLQLILDWLFFVSMNETK